LARSLGPTRSASWSANEATAVSVDEKSVASVTSYLPEARPAECG